MNLEEKYKKILFTIGKIVITAGLFYWMFTKLNIGDIKTAVQNCNYYYLIVATIFFIDSKVISAYRLNEYFKSIGLNVSQKVNMKMYLLGMYYNTLLPGGVGGDALKAIMLKDMYGDEIKMKKLASSLLMDRLIGLLALCVLILIFIPFIDFEQHIHTPWIKDAIKYLPYSIIITAISGGVIFYIINRYLLKESLKVFTTTFAYSILIVLLQTLCFYLILESIHLSKYIFEFLFFFNISTVASVLPVTIGGAGLREFVFFGLCGIFHFKDKLTIPPSSTEISIESFGFSATVIFYVMATGVALTGVYYGFFPERAKKE